MEREGLDSGDVAERMSDLLGRDVKVELVDAYAQRTQLDKIPQAWVSALGLEPLEADPSGEGTGAGSFSDRSAERAPRMPPGAPKAKPPAVLATVAKERLSATYETIGYAAGLILEEPGIKVVTDDYAPHIAEAWLKAAEENEFAARVVRLMSSGGAMGELVTVHILWILGIAYVTGRVDDPTGLLARKYRGEHDAAVQRAAERAAAANGHADVAYPFEPGAGAGDAVGEPPQPTPI